MLVMSLILMYNISEVIRMKRINLYVTDEQDAWLIEQTKKLGLSGKSELVRRIIDKDKEGK